MLKPRIDSESSERPATLREHGEALILLLPFLVGLGIATLFGGILGAVIWIVMTCVGTDRLVVNIAIRSIMYLVLIAIFFPLFGHKRAGTRAKICLSHIQQVTQGTLLYAQNYDGNLPPALVSSGMSFPYIQDRSILVCPEDRNNTGSYALNTNVKSVAFHAMAWPEKTILVYEGKANTLDYRHRDRTTIGFADGHCKLIAPPDITTLFWTPQAPPNLPNPSPALPLGQPAKAETIPETGGPVYMR